MATMAVDPAADHRRDQPGRQEPDRQPAHREGERPAALGRDQRHGQHRRIEQCAPGENLRHAEQRHGAPGTEQNVAW